jgi:hypothetical protein
VTRKKDPEFFGAIKGAVAARLVKRLQRIESEANGWQSCAWLVERLLPSRYAKPEVQISLNSSLSPTHNAHTLTISLEEAQRIEAQAEPIREATRKMIEAYQRNRNTDSPQSVSVSAQSSLPPIPLYAWGNFTQNENSLGSSTKSTKRFYETSQPLFTRISL